MSSEILEKYKSEIPSISKEKLIGRKRYETMLVGCLPFGDQELYFNNLSWPGTYRYYEFTPLCANVAGLAVSQVGYNSARVS